MFFLDDDLHVSILESRAAGKIVPAPSGVLVPFRDLESPDSAPLPCACRAGCSRPVWADFVNRAGELGRRV